MKDSLMIFDMNIKSNLREDELENSYEKKSIMGDENDCKRGEY